MNKVLYCLIVIILTGCNLTPSRLTCLNIRLWQDTPAWGLAKAVRNGDTVRIKKILAKGGGSVDYREPTYGQSLLHWAVLRNKAEMVEFLLKQGADINLRDYWSSASPILLACYHSDTDAEIVRILLNNGANPNDLATENDSVLEGNRRTPFTPLIVAASNSLEKVKLLIEAGADPYYCWEPGQNALKEAGTLRRFDIAEYLLIDCGMDPSRSFTITIVGDTLHFRDILDRNPNFRNTVENSASLKRIYQYLDEWEKKHEADSIFRHN